MHPYTGRFAPSPSGPLHLGSLYTAVASYLDARAHHGRWLLRIEDIDPPREQAGASQAIIDCLACHSLHWDGEILYQSQRSEAYDLAIRQLQQQGHCYYCRCSRKDLQLLAGGYNGACRDLGLDNSMPCAIRLRTDDNLDTRFNDRLQGPQTATPCTAGCVDDFVIFRKDGLYAYQLAVVVDDIAQAITDVVRGSDMLDSTFKQAWLYHHLAKPPPRYLHLPVLNNRQGQKLSKQNRATAVDLHQPCNNLLRVLQLLNQPLPPPSMCHQPQDILSWACEHWRPAVIKRSAGISC